MAHDLSDIVDEIRKINLRLKALEESRERATTSPVHPAAAATPQYVPKADLKSEVEKELALKAAYIPAKPISNDNYVLTSDSDKAEKSTMMSTGSIIGAIGIICFVFGAALIVRMAIESGWLTPFRQWGLVALLGSVISIVGVYLRERDNDYAGYLAGAGTVILYFAAYSGSLVFDVYSPGFSIVLVTCVSALSLWLFSLFSNEFFGVTAALGTYLAPLFLGYMKSDFEVVAAYFCIWTFVFSFISTMLASRTLALISAYCGIGIFALINLGQRGQDNLLLVIMVQTIQFMSVLAGVVAFSIKYESPMQKEEVWSYFPALLFFYGTQYFFLHRWSPDIAPYISLGFAVVLLAAVQFARGLLDSKYAINSEETVWSFCAVVFFHSVYLNILPEVVKPYLVAIIVLAVILLKSNKSEAKAHWSFSLIFGVILLLELGRITIDLTRSDLSPTLVPAIGAVLLMLIAYRTTIEDQYADNAPIYLAFTHFLAVMCLYNIAQQFGPVAISIAWGVYAILLIGYGHVSNDKVLTKSSIIVLFIAAAKVLIYDARNYSTELRIVCLLITGALLYGAGYFFRNVVHSDKSH